MEYVLMHHGIKGQKWGVRRYQNKDGSLTPAGKKRLAKNEAYRDKLANKAQVKYERALESAKNARQNVKDLRKNGVNSQVYKDWKEQQDREREWKYENDERNRVTGEDGRTYVRKYSTSRTKFADDFFDSMFAKTKVQDLIDENNKAAYEYRKVAKQWTETNQKLMNMEVSALTKKGAIRLTYYGF